MVLRLAQFNNLFYPDSGSGGGGGNAPVLEDSSLTADGILDILNEEPAGEGGDENPDDNNLPEGKGKGKEGKETPKGKEKENEEPSGDEEDENEEQPEGEEELEELELEPEERDELEYKDIPKRKEILKEYPELFKKFPGIEHAIYREQRFSEVFPTIKEAKDAQENSAQFAKFEESILGGDITHVLKAAKQADEDAYNKIIETLPLTLQKMDGKAYSAVISQNLKAAAISMFTEGKRMNTDEGKELMIAAQILHKFAFGSDQITPYKYSYTKPSNEDGKGDEREQKLTEREQQFAQRQLETAVDDVTSRVKNITRSTIEKHIDTKNIMTPYVRSNAIKDIMDRVDEAIMEDSRFKKILDRHWQNAYDDNYSTKTKEAIRNVLLTKIKTVLPDIIKTVKAEAMKGQSRRAIESGEREERQVNNRSSQRNNNEERVRTPRNNQPSNGGKSRDGKGMSTYDFFNQD